MRTKLTQKEQDNITLRVIGMHKHNVENILEDEDIEYRIIRVDHEPMICTQDLHPDRANLELLRNRIVGVSWG